MEDNLDVNKISVDDEDPTKLEFKYNFIGIPWDDRTRKSKIGIITLLIAIFLALLGCIVNNFVMHYQGFTIANNNTNAETNCFRVRNDEYRYVARIYSVLYKEILCVGAVVSPTSILANGVCVKSGAIRIHLGSPTDPQCKKGLPVDNYISIFYDGVLSKELVIIKYEDHHNCASFIAIRYKYDISSKMFVIGRSSVDDGKYLSRHYVSLAHTYLSLYNTHNLNISNLICVNDLTKCPAKVGDLLVHNNVLIGLASTSIQSSENFKLICFADLKTIRYQLQATDDKISAL